MKKSEPWLAGTDFVFHEPADCFHANSDTYLLGSFLRLKHNDTVLDIGTNTGALLLYASLFQPQKLIGVDINEKAIAQAEVNLKDNHVIAELFTMPVQQLNIPPFTAIVCNPPYFDSRQMTKDGAKGMARADGTLSMLDLFAVTKRLLKDHGKLFLVQRPQQLENIILEASRVHLHLTRLCFAYDRPGGRAKTVLLEFSKNVSPALEVMEPVYLNAPKNKTAGVSSAG